MENNSSSQPTGYLLGKFGLAGLLIGLILAAWYNQVVIVILIGLALSAAVLAKLWSRLSLTGVSCQRTLSEWRIFSGEQIELKLRLVNHKILPVPWVQVENEIPGEFGDDFPLIAGNRLGTRLLSKRAALLWYMGVSWRQQLQCNKRGYYLLGPINITSGDIFGFYPRSIVQPSIDQVIVYPRIFPITELGIPSLDPVGENTAERRIFEDPVRVIGVRDYTPHDSLRRIHWKVSARHQQLQVKVFEPTTTLKVAIMVAIETFPSEGTSSEEDFELGMSTAASAANYLIKRRCSVGLYVNSRLADSGQPVKIMPGSGSGHMVSLLEALAKVTRQESNSFEEFVQEEQVGLPWGTTLMIVLRRASKALTGLLVNLKESGYKILVLQVGNEGGSSVEPTISWYHIGEPSYFMDTGSKELE